MFDNIIYWYATALVNGKRCNTIRAYTSLEDFLRLLQENPIGTDIEIWEAYVTTVSKKLEVK
jgi:hypothetical protein